MQAKTRVIKIIKLYYQLSKLYFVVFLQFGLSYFSLRFYYKKLRQIKLQEIVRVNNQTAMKSLESEKNPLRINRDFYRPSDPKRTSNNKRSFPNAYKKSSPLLDVAEPASVIAYVGELEKVKPIHREFCHVDMYYPDKKKDMKRAENMYGTISRSRRKSVSSFLTPVHHRSIEQEREQFIRTFRQKSQKKEQQNLSFYNTTAKSKFIMNKFHDDLHINDRSSPTFQNMLNRTLIIDDILGRVNRNQRKFVHGF